MVTAATNHLVRLSSWRFAPTQITNGEDTCETQTFRAVWSGAVSRACKMFGAPGNDADATSGTASAPS